MKTRVRVYYGGYAEYDVRLLGKLARTRTPCSCLMCRNPRRNGELPVAERSIRELAERGLA